METLDVNDQGAKTTHVDISGMSRLAVYAKPDVVGTIRPVMLLLQLSPDGSTWFNYIEFNPKRYQSFDVLGLEARLKVSEVAGQTAELEIHFMTGA